jgi:hypothetical protein
MRRVAAALGSTIVLAVVLVACGDSGTPVSTEAFCSRLADLRQRNPLEDAISDQAAADEVAAILDDLISTSPQQVRSDLRTFRRLVDDLRNLDSSDPQAAEDAVRELATPDVISSGQSLAKFARDECGFDDVFPTGAEGG